MPAAAAAPDRTEASCLSPSRTAASGTQGSSPRELTSHTLRSRAISSANTRRKRRSPRAMPTRRVSTRPTGSRSWSGTTSYSGSPTLRSSGSTVRSQSARPTARPQGWPHWPRSTNTSRGAKRSPRTSTKGTAISNSLPASMRTRLATPPTSQNATIRRAKQRDSTSTCNTTYDVLGPRALAQNPYTAVAARSRRVLLGMSAREHVRLGLVPDRVVARGLDVEAVFVDEASAERRADRHQQGDDNREHH